MAIHNKIFVLLSGIYCLAGCATMQRTDLYFGRNIPGGGQVSDGQWAAFSDSIITPNFPQGYTETDAQGKWMDTEKRKTIAENTKVITIIGKRSTKRNRQLNHITQTYIHRFHQQAVLRVDTRIRHRLISKNGIN